MRRRGPKTKVSKGERRHEQITITLPAEIHDQILEIMEDEEHLSKSEIIAILIQAALTTFDLDLIVF